MSDSKANDSLITMKQVEEKINRLLKFGFGRVEVTVFNHYIKAVSITETMVSQKET